MTGFWTKSAGVGGRLLSDGDFVVEEIPLKKFFVKYVRGPAGVSPVEGRYFLYRLSKRGMTTSDALKLIRERFGLDNIGYAGLKDKHAVTTQYITLKKDVGSFSEDVVLERIGPTNNMMQIGELEGNRFMITLHGCRPGIADVVVELENNGIPNYFGPQRFSSENGEIGMLLLQRKYNEALGMIRKNTRRDLTALEQVDKKILKFFIHAYQSSLFNRVLDAYISSSDKPCFEKFPIAGNDTTLGNDFAGRETKKLLKQDNVSAESFEFKDLRLRCLGSSRNAFVKVKIDYEIQNDNIIVHFDLPPGSYATVLLKEITKDDYA